MPGMDGTGPRGLGPMTGGGRGWCNPYFWGARFPFLGWNPYLRPYGWGPYVPFYAPYLPFGWGRGWGRGWWW